ncbi:MAG: 2'-5' RNA ligase family protein [Flavobacterium sp.]
MTKTYSIVFYPSPSIINLVKEMKDNLKSRVKEKWYNSCNSVAHITICELKLDESELYKLKQKISEVCDTFTPFEVYLDHFGSFDNAGAFYIGPNEKSKKNLELLMTKIQNALRSFKIDKISSNAHMSIGRRLTAENLKIASELFTTIDINFLCDSIVLRELEPYKQFFAIQTFPFGSNPQPELIQGSLF